MTFGSKFDLPKIQVPDIVYKELNRRLDTGETDVMVLDNNGSWQYPVSRDTKNKLWSEGREILSLSKIREFEKEIIYPEVIELGRRFLDVKKNYQYVMENQTVRGLYKTVMKNVKKPMAILWM